jgi:hypothetical protein
MSDQEQAGHGHEGEEGDVLGMAVGFRIFEDGGDLYLAEAEISPYEDEPTALGVTLVFHSLAGIDPTSEEGDDAEPLVFEFDDELTRDEGGSIVAQAQDILRQLSSLTPESLREYLQAAREDADADEDEA